MIVPVSHARVLISQVWTEKLISVAFPKITHLCTNPTCLLTPNICPQLFQYFVNHQEWFQWQILHMYVSRTHANSDCRHIPVHGRYHVAELDSVTQSACVGQLKITTKLVSILKTRRDVSRILSHLTNRLWKHVATWLIDSLLKNDVSPVVCICFPRSQW